MTSTRGCVNTASELTPGYEHIDADFTGVCCTGLKMKQRLPIRFYKTAMTK